MQSKEPVSREESRLEILDLFRFLAALVVFLGHVVFFSEYGASWGDKYWIQSIHTGTFAVDFFFLLSGFVLSGKKPTKKWLISRFIRLYPVYFVGLCFGACVNLASSGKLFTSTMGVVFSLLGIQSFFPAYQLALNPPLWSVSVEIVLTPLFIFLFKFRKKIKNLYFFFMISYVFSIIFENSLVIRGIPFFILGSIMFSGNRPVPRKGYGLAVVALVFMYISIGANIFTQIGYSWSDLLIKYVVLIILVYCLLGVNLTGHVATISAALGKRSYALYAVHAPLIGAALGVFNPDSPKKFFVYFFSLLAITPVFTEITYKFVDLRAIRGASGYLKGKL